MMRSRINSVEAGSYVFQPTEYDNDGNLLCSLYRCRNNGRDCMLKGIYDFNEEKFTIIHIKDGWLSRSHKIILDYFLKEYDWL
jgi:hypothetical protein